jgi:NTE family protein
MPHLVDLLRRSRTKHRGTIGLALGSGAARGWAHIGAIRALEEAGLEIGMIAGTSIGSLVGAAFASGRLDSLEDVVRELDWRRAIALFDVSLPRSGLLDGTKVTASIREHFESGDISDLAIPFCAISTDLVDGSEVLIRDGDVIDAVRASISVPGVFTPVRRGSRLLVDGGLVDPVPAGVVRRMGADFVVAIDLNHGAAGVGPMDRRAYESTDGRHGGQPGDHAVAGRLRAQLAAVGERLGSTKLLAMADGWHWFRQDSLPNILEVLISSLNVMEMQITDMQLEKEPPDVLLRPRLEHIRPMDFHRGDEAIAEGHRAAVEGLRDAGIEIPD